jgi:long-chain acyl-CoA synthetase
MGQLGIWNIAEREPDRLALVDADHEGTTFGELHREANRLVHALRARGLATGDVVATLLLNSRTGVALSLATSQAGLYLVPINYHFTAAEAGYILADPGGEGLGGA